MFRLSKAVSFLSQNPLLFRQLRRGFTASPNNIPFTKDLYKILGVDAKADKAKIKTAYANLVKKHHPDVNKGASSAELFKDINLAYSVLSSDEKKKDYDQYIDQKNRMGNYSSSFSGSSQQSANGGRYGTVLLI